MGKVRIVLGILLVAIQIVVLYTIRDSVYYYEALGNLLYFISYNLIGLTGMIILLLEKIEEKNKKEIIKVSLASLFIIGFMLTFIPLLWMIGIILILNSFFSIKKT